MLSWNNLITYPPINALTTHSSQRSLYILVEADSCTPPPPPAQTIITMNTNRYHDDDDDDGGMHRGCGRIQSCFPMFGLCGLRRLLRQRRTGWAADALSVKYDVAAKDVAADALAVKYGVAKKDVAALISILFRGYKLDGLVDLAHPGRGRRERQLLHILTNRVVDRDLRILDLDLATVNYDIEAAHGSHELYHLSGEIVELDKLESLSLSTFHSLPQEITRLENLTRLTLSGRRSRWDHLRWYWELPEGMVRTIGACKKIQELALVSVTSIPSQISSLNLAGSFKLLYLFDCDRLDELPPVDLHVEELVVAGRVANVVDDAMRMPPQLISWIRRHLPKLKKLSLYYVGNAGELIEAIINGNDISDDRDRTGDTPCSFLATLLELSVQRCFLQDCNLETILIRAVPLFPNLTVVDLGRNDICRLHWFPSRYVEHQASAQRDGLRTGGSAMDPTQSSYPRLKQLVLDGNPVVRSTKNPQEEAAFVAVLQVFPQLSYFTLFDNDFALVGVWEKTGSASGWPERIKYLLRINRGGRVLVGGPVPSFPSPLVGNVVVEAYGTVTQNMGTPTGRQPAYYSPKIPPSVWPRVLERAYKTSAGLGRGGEWRWRADVDRDLTALYYLLRHSDVLRESGS